MGYELDKAKSLVNLLDYVQSQGHSTKKIGTNDYRVNPCMVCDGKDHFTIYANTNTYSSFSDCCKGGSIVDYLQEVEGMSLDSAIDKIFELAEMDKEKAINGCEPSTARKEIVQNNFTTKEEELLKDFKNYYAGLAKEDNTKAYEYLQTRGISKDTVLRHNILYDSYHNSVIIPINNNHYVYRAVIGDAKGNGKDSKTGTFNAKYLSDLQIKRIFVVESAIDAMTLETIGYNAIATNSTANVNQFVELAKGTRQDKVYILAFDNDKRGRIATEKVKAELDQAGIKNITLDIPSSYKDINSFYLGNPEKLKQDIQILLQEYDKKIMLAGTSYEYLITTFNDEMVKCRDEKIIKTGIDGLDNVLGGGLYPGLYVFGAATSLGKTAFMGQVADYIANQEIDVLFFALEMSKYEMVCRSLAREMHLLDKKSLLGTRDIMQGKANGTLMGKALGVYAKASKHMRIIEGNFGTGIDEIKNKVNAHFLLFGKKPVVFVDYLQILKAKDLRMTERQAIDYNLIELKRLSRDMQTPIIVISNLNRGNYIKQLDFEALKESGCIEYTADVVFGLQLNCIDEIKDSDKDVNVNRKKIQDAKSGNTRELQLILLKNRRGVSNAKIDLRHYPAHNYFTETKI